MLELESPWKSVRHANFLSNSRHLAPNSAKATLDFIMLIPSGILISVRFPKGKIKDVSVKVSSPPGIAFVLAVEAFGRHSSRRGGHSDGRCCAVLSMAVAWPNFFPAPRTPTCTFEVCCSASSELWGYDPGVHLCISWPFHCMFLWILHILGAFEVSKGMAAAALFRNQSEGARLSAEQFFCTCFLSKVKREHIACRANPLGTDHTNFCVRRPRTSVCFAGDSDTMLHVAVKGGVKGIPNSQNQSG